MSEQPLVSIITPSYNMAEFLEATIESVLSQNYSNLEYIIIDGGSTDGSVEIIKKYEKHLSYWCSETDSGHYSAINKGFAISKGEIMAWLNASDIYFPWTIKTVSRIMLELPEVEWLTSLSPVTIDRKGVYLSFGHLRGIAKSAFLDSCNLPWKVELLKYKLISGVGYIQQESTFWKRSLWSKSGSCIRESYELAGDFDLWARFYKVSNLYAVETPLAAFRVHENQKSEKIDAYNLEASQSLVELRKLESWSPNYFRQLLLMLRVYKFGIISDILAQLAGYTGQKIVREKPNSLESRWKIINYKFL
jgi:glycosyltransferase involved in cell wall biosynthesis